MIKAIIKNEIVLFQIFGQIDFVPKILKQIGY
jgi:hypothetical protein